MDGQTLADHLIRSGVLKTPEIVAAFRSVDRADFVPERYRAEAYRDYPLLIGSEQTISQPTTVAFMLELLQPRPGDRVLDVGSGSGWTTALLAHIVGTGGRVIGLEIVPELVKFGRKNLARYQFAHVEIRQAGNAIGLPDEAPFDKILVSAAADEIPRELTSQIKAGGRLVIPVRGSVWKIEALASGALRREEFPGFAFVPLK